MCGLRALLGRLCGALQKEAKAMGGLAWTFVTDGGAPLTGDSSPLDRPELTRA